MPTAEEQGAPEGDRKTSTFRLWAISTVLVLLVTGLVLEGLAYGFLKFKGRVRDVSHGPHLTSVYRSHRLNPDYRYRLLDRSSVRLHSPDGFREALPVPKIKAPNTFRVVAMGGSTLYGIEAGDPYPYHPALLSDQTIDFYMEQSLNARLEGTGRQVEVVNAGVVAYQTFQHLVHINERLLQYDPDMFVFLDGHNDFYTATEDFSHWEDYSYGPWVAVSNLDDPSLFFAVYTASRYFGQVSNFGFLVFEALHRIWQRRLTRYTNQGRPSMDIAIEDLPTRYEGVAQSGYLRVYRQIKAVADYEGIDMMVFLQPEVVLENPDSLNPTDQRLREITLEDSDRKAQSMNTISHMIEPLFRELDVDFKDISRIAQGADGDQYYTDYCHLTPAGARLVGQLMADAIWPRVSRWAAQP